MNLIVEESARSNMSENEFEITQIKSNLEEYDFQNIVRDSNLGNGCSPG